MIGPGSVPELAAAELPPIGGVWLSAWTTAWVPNLVMAAATVGYLILLWRRRIRRGLAWRGRLVAWMVAMAALVASFNSSVSLYSDTLFWAHMIQHLLLIMVIPPFLVWADVWSLVPARRGRTVADVLDSSRTWRFLTFPLFSVPLYAAVVILTHVTTFQQIAVTHPHLRIAENLLYLVSGYLLFAELVRAGAATHRIPDLVRIATIIAAMGVDTLSGISLMLTERALAPAYAAAHPGWGPSALADQNTAGAVMWVFGDLLMMCFMTVVGVLWGLRHEEVGVGDWLETIRRREILGDQAAAVGAGADPNIDLDQAALDAYNARLAVLHERDTAAGN